MKKGKLIKSICLIGLTGIIFTGCGDKKSTEDMGLYGYLPKDGIVKLAVLKPLSETVKDDDLYNNLLGNQTLGRSGFKSMEKQAKKVVAVERKDGTVDVYTDMGKSEKDIIGNLEEQVRKGALVKIEDKTYKFSKQGINDVYFRVDGSNILTTRDKDHLKEALANKANSEKSEYVDDIKKYENDNNYAELITDNKSYRDEIKKELKYTVRYFKADKDKLQGGMDFVFNKDAVKRWKSRYFTHNGEDGLAGDGKYSPDKMYLRTSVPKDEILGLLNNTDKLTTVLEINKRDNNGETKKIDKNQFFFLYTKDGSSLKGYVEDDGVKFKFDGEIKDGILMYIPSIAMMTADKRDMVLDSLIENLEKLSSN